MASARNISRGFDHSSGQVSTSLGRSISPMASFHSPPSSYGVNHLSRTNTRPFAKQLKPFATEDIKILLLENVNQTGQDILAKQGYQVEFLKSSLPEDELIAKIRFGRLIIRAIRSNLTCAIVMFM